MLDRILLAGSQVVGAVLIIAALLKVTNANKFFAHLIQFGWLPVPAWRILVPLLLALEASLGSALLAVFAPRFTLPIAALVLIVLTGVTVWSVKTGKSEDCECYGDAIKLSLWQSIALNAVYIAFVAGAWGAQPSAGTAVWKPLTVIAILIVMTILSRYSLEQQIRTGRRLFQGESPLKKGQSWDPRWAGKTQLAPRDNLVAFLGPACPHCKEWVRVLNVIHSTESLPPVTAVMGAGPRLVRAFVDETGATMPITQISSRMFELLAPGVPTTVLVENGQIKEVWDGRMSSSFRKRFMLALFPATQSQKPEDVADAAVPA